MDYINSGMPTLIWHGIPANYLLRRCADAMETEAECMSYVASLMNASEAIKVEEWDAAESALHAVESRLMADWEAINGAPRLNRHGQYYGGAHPALV